MKVALGFPFYLLFYYVEFRSGRNGYYITHLIWPVRSMCVCSDSLIYSVIREDFFPLLKRFSTLRSVDWSWVVSRRAPLYFDTQQVLKPQRQNSLSSKTTSHWWFIWAFLICSLVEFSTSSSAVESRFDERVPVLLGSCTNTQAAWFTSAQRFHAVTLIHSWWR